MVVRRAISSAKLTLTVILLVLTLTLPRSVAQERSKDERRGHRTMGGKQLWTDHFVHRGWRIQRYVLTGHFRLLDEQNRRHAWGSFNHCRAEFEQRRLANPIPALKPRVVITLHGLGRTRQSMEGIGSFLDQQAEFDWINMSYASTRDDLNSHAEALHQVISGLQGVEQVDFVAHSLGNLVIRRYLHSLAERKQLPEGYPKIGRIVMLAPPNGGAEMAERLRDNGLFHFLLGVNGMQLAREWDEMQKTLATPEAQFGIIAGAVPKPVQGNPVIAGPDDLVVSVAETKLLGARDFLVVPAVHAFIMNQDEVHDAVLSFLQHGFFVTDDQRQPIE